MRVPRIAWGARRRKPGPGRLDPAEVVGIALHWPAMSKPVRGVRAVSAALRSWQQLHMVTNGWSDIAYQEAIDQDGNVYGLRGLRNQSAANGYESVNEQYGAILLVLAPNEKPSAAMIAAVRKRIARHRRLFPRSVRVVGHGDLKSTTCPGPIAQALIERGTFTP